MVVTPTPCTDGNRVLKVGFYAYFAPVSYSADPDPSSPGFNVHLGYEADLLTALEAMEGVQGCLFPDTALVPGTTSGCDPQVPNSTS